MRWAFGNISAFKNHFCTIVKRKKKGGISLRDKLSVFIFWISYSLSLFVFFSTIFGFLSLITINPDGIIVDWDIFISPLALSIIITSSLLLVWIISLIMSQKTSSILKVIVSMFSIGLVIPFYIVAGIIKAIFGGKMNWFLVKKKGNEIEKNTSSPSS